MFICLGEKVSCQKKGIHVLRSERVSSGLEPAKSISRGEHAMHLDQQAEQTSHHGMTRNSVKLQCSKCGVK